VCAVQIPVAVTVNSAALRDVTSCILVEIHRRFRKLACLNYQSGGVTVSGVSRGVWVVQPPPPPRNSEDIGGVLDRMSKKQRRLDFLL